MFREIYNMLKSDDWVNVSEDIEILKGKYAKINDWKDAKNKKLRKLKSITNR